MVRPQSNNREKKRDAFVTTSAQEFSSRTIEIRRVARMVAGGRRFRFRAFVAVGNQNGVVGVGIGKGADVRRAVEKATRRARASCITVSRRHGTIPREIFIKKGSAKILLRPAKSGHGIVAGGVIRILCDLAGITDISAKILSRSTNNLAHAQAVLEAFRQLSDRVAIAAAKHAASPPKAHEKA